MMDLWQHWWKGIRFHNSYHWKIRTFLIGFLQEALVAFTYSVQHTFTSNLEPYTNGAMLAFACTLVALFSVSVF